MLVLPKPFLQILRTSKIEQRPTQAVVAEDMREETKGKNQLIADKSFEAVSDPSKLFVAPQAESTVPYFNFAPLQNALARLQENARNYERAMASSGSGKPLALKAQKGLDRILIQTERALIRSEGLPRRPWYKHLIYAPGFYTGYGVKTLPGVQEALEERHWKEAEEQIEIAAQALTQFNQEIEKATVLVNQTRAR